jgi:hypothetical protein
VTYRLDDVPVVDVSLRLAEGTGVCPGARPELILSVVTADAKRLVTRGAGGGNLDFGAFRFESTLGSVQDGRLLVPADPREIQVSTLTVRATPLGHPRRATTLDVPIHYACRFVAEFSARDGDSGIDGTAGQGGSNAAHGACGQDGQDGARGADARPLEVQVRAVQRPGTAHPLAELSVRRDNDERVYVVDPEGGWITIRAEGGAGGKGGSGGVGGYGGAASTCEKHCHPHPQRGGDGGPGGDGGAGGDGGKGGAIRVIATRETEPLLAAVAFANAGGAGGRGGAGGAGGGGGAGAHDGADGSPGASGAIGPVGEAGEPGPRVEIELLDAARKRRAAKR